MSKSSQKILAIDPGERVGWATGTQKPGGPILLDHGVAHLKDFALALAKRIDTYDTVIYETWRLYPHKARKLVGNDMQPSQLVGMIRLLAWLHPNIKLVSQGADVKKTGWKVMPDAWRKSCELSSEQHDQDAVMHLAHYVWKNS